MHRDDMVPLVAMLFPVALGCGPRGRSRDAIPTPLPYVSVAPPSLVTLPHFFDNAVYSNHFKAHTGRLQYEMLTKRLAVIPWLGSATMQLLGCV